MKKKADEYLYNEALKYLGKYPATKKKISEILKDTGININTVPVLDVRRKKSHKIIGSRSFSYNTSTVTKLGKLCVDFYQSNKIIKFVSN